MHIYSLLFSRCQATDVINANGKYIGRNDVQWERCDGRRIGPTVLIGEGGSLSIVDKVEAFVKPRKLPQVIDFRYKSLRSHCLKRLLPAVISSCVADEEFYYNYEYFQLIFLPPKQTY